MKIKKVTKNWKHHRLPQMMNNKNKILFQKAMRSTQMTGIMNLKYNVSIKYQVLILLN